MTNFSADDATFDDRFGYTVSLGLNTALVGALGPAPEDIGAAYVFVRMDDAWTRQVRLVASNGTDDYFGNLVTLDGDRALIGALGNNDNDERPGSAYVFVSNEGA